MRTCKECGSTKYYAKGLCQKHYMKHLRKDKPKKKRGRKKKQVQPCIQCGKLEHEARGLCKSCYWQWWKSEDKTDTEGLQYDDNGRMLYNKDFHPNQGTPWTDDDLEYLCKFYDIDGKKKISFALGRTEGTIAQTVMQLKKKGLYEQYKKSYERKLAD